MLKNYRTKRGLTQDELAKEIGVTRPVISQLERGLRRPGKEIMKRLNEFDPDAFPLPENRWWEKLATNNVAQQK